MLSLIFPKCTEHNAYENGKTFKRLIKYLKKFKNSSNLPKSPKKSFFNIKLRLCMLKLSIVKYF